MITARVGRSSMPMPGKTFPCASCHGSDGRGRPEGGVVPANITWSRLTQTVHATGEARPRSPYNAETVGRAISAGLNSDGVALDATMPRFEMEPEDLRDLLAYLRRLEQDLDHGLTERAIALGTIVPKGATPDALGAVVTTVLSGYLDDINAEGGIYNRRLELTAIEAATHEHAVDQMTKMLGEGRVFALVGAVTVGMEREMERLTEEYGIPLVGPLAQPPRHEDSLQRQTFYLFSGLTVQSRVLVEFAAKTLAQGPLHIGIVYPDGEKMDAVIASIRHEAKSLQRDVPTVLVYSPGSFSAADTAVALSKAKVNALLFLGSDRELRGLAQESVRHQWVPFLLVPSASTGAALLELPNEFDGRIFFASPNGPADYTAEGLADFAAFQARHRLPRHHLAAQVSAYAAVKVLVEGLKRTGASVSRERLMTALEQLYEFRTGMTPAVTYGPTRRVGAQGAHVSGIDLANKRFQPSSVWISVQ